MKCNSDSLYIYLSNIILDYIFFKIEDARKAKILLSLSGGIDSTVLADILIKMRNKYKFRIEFVHFNHAINSNSFLTEAACLKYSKKNRTRLLLYKLNFDKMNNFECKAREKRYKIINDLQSKNKYTLVMTAHNKNDQIETLIMRSKNKSDWLSMIGIWNNIDYIFRPMLNIYKNDILSYAINEKLSWVEDPTNLDTKFKRNNIRHNIYPMLINSAPYLINHLLKNSIFYKNKLQSILSYYDCYFKKYNIYTIDGNIIVPKKVVDNLHRKENLKIFVYWLYSRFMKIKFKGNISKKHWYQCHQFISSEKNFGKFYLSQDYLIIKNREDLIFSKSLIKTKKIIAPITNRLKWYNSIFKISLNKINKSNNSKNNIFLNKTDGIFVRNWIYGDKIKFNAKTTHHKLLSNIFINNKLTIYEKSIQPVVCNQYNEIIWLPGLMKPHITIDNQNKLLKISWNTLK